MISDITNAISIRLHEMFSSAEIYLEPVEQGFQPGSFAIQQGLMSEKQLVDNRYRQTYSFTVLYWPKDETEPIKEINILQYDILDALEYIRVGDLIIRGENRSAKITDLVLSVFVDYSLHVFKPKEEAELQMNLAADAKVKGD